MVSTGDLFVPMAGGMSVAGIVNWIVFGIFILVWAGLAYFLIRAFIDVRKHPTEVVDHILKGNTEIIEKKRGGYVKDGKTGKTFFEVFSFPSFWRKQRLATLPESKHFTPLRGFMKSDCVHRIVSGPSSYAWVEPELGVGEHSRLSFRNFEFDKNSAMQTIRDEWSIRQPDQSFLSRWGTQIVMFSFITIVLVLGIVFLDRFMDVAGSFQSTAKILTDSCVQKVGGG